jgi:hypothetical protein
MNEGAIIGDQYWPSQGILAMHNRAANGWSGREETMTNAMTAFVVAAGGAAMVSFYLLMTRVENRRRIRRSSADGVAPDPASYFGGDGWSISNWFGGGDSAFDGSGHQADSSGFHGAGGDFGGGGADGGGGGGGDGGGGGGDGGGGGH